VNVIRNFMDIEGKMVSIKRCMSLLNIEQEAADPIISQETMVQQHAEWPEEGRVEFEDVVLRYRPETEVVLNRLNFEVRAGEKIGIVGRTGAGKSTICLSMSRIIELSEGRIKIDGIEIAHLPL
jgi:ABC-type multidrug transport system fused ATPase/permease subunit